MRSLAGRTTIAENYLGLPFVVSRRAVPAISDTIWSVRLDRMAAGVEGTAPAGNLGSIAGSADVLARVVLREGIGSH